MNFKVVSGSRDLFLNGCYQEARLVQKLDISIIFFWRQEEQSETRDNVGKKAEITQKTEQLVIL